MCEILVSSGPFGGGEDDDDEGAGAAVPASVLRNEVVEELQGFVQFCSVKEGVESSTLMLFVELRDEVKAQNVSMRVQS